MSWFDEQLNVRRETDDRDFSDSLSMVAGAVMGKRLCEALDAKETAQSAIDEILKYYHCQDRATELPAGIESLEDQLDFRMQPLGIARRNVRLESGWYRHAIGAMIGTLAGSGAAVALIPGRFSGYHFIDPETGKTVRLSRRTEGLLDSEAVCFYQPLPQRSLSIRDLLVFLAQTLNLSDIVLFVGIMGIITLVGLLSPLFTKWLFGDVLESGSLSVLMALAGFMGCYSLCRFLLSTIQEIIKARVQIKQDVAVQAAVMNRLMSLPASFFRGFSSGELYQRADYIRNLCSLLVNSLGSVGLSSLFSFIYLGQIFAFAPALVVPSLLITLISATLSTITALMQIKVSRERMKNTAKTGGLTYATIRGIQKVKLAGAEKRMFSRYAKNYAREVSLTYNSPLFLRLSGTISLAVSLFGTLVLYALAVKSGVDVANYYAFTAAYGNISAAFMAMASIAMTVSSIRPTLEMARPILEAEPEISDGKQVVTELRGDIELTDVSFRYDENMPFVVNNLSLKIKSGEYLAIVGSTGCGKSTLMRLLLGFEKPQKGSIYFDRKDMAKLDLKSLRRHIGTVMQDGKLFLGDIYSNIVISAPRLSVSDAWEAAEIASIAEDIRRMPMGMNTIISEGQGGISGGQKQRLMIARAVAPKPRILMFDEATSALDNLTQKKVAEAIDKLDCTRIVIAHRLSTIRHADRILYLEGGRIAEEGTYEELIAKNGKFASLVERQRLDLDVE